MTSLLPLYYPNHPLCLMIDLLTARVSFNYTSDSSVRPCDTNEPVRGNMLRETAQGVMEPTDGAFVSHGASDTSNLVSLVLECVCSNGCF